jgi:hypothetical protein
MLENITYISEAAYTTVKHIILDIILIKIKETVLCCLNNDLYIPVIAREIS